MSGVRLRAGVVLLQHGELALIEPTRETELYYLLPGWMVDEGESAEQAAQRESAEELGLEVEIGPLLARVDVTRGNSSSTQLYFLAHAVGGTFGTGTGEEFLYPVGAGHGTYRPVWRDLADCVHLDVRPCALVLALATRGIEELIRHPLSVLETKPSVTW